MVREKWSPEKFTGKLVPRKKITGKKMPRKIPGKMVPAKLVPRKNILKKLFSVERILGNLNDFFIFIDWFHYTHKKVFDVHVTILHTPNCRKLKESRKVCCRVMGFYKLITSQHFAHHNARRSHHDFLFPSSGFVVEFWVFIDWSHPNILHTHTTMLNAHLTIFYFRVLGLLLNFGLS